MQKGFLVFERLVNAISHGLKSFSYCFLFLIVLVINILLKTPILLKNLLFTLHLFTLKGTILVFFQIALFYKNLSDTVWYIGGEG